MAEVFTDWQCLVLPETHLPSPDCPTGWAAFPGSDGVWKPSGLTYDPKVGNVLVLWRRLLITVVEIDDDEIGEEAEESETESDDSAPVAKRDSWN